MLAFRITLFGFTIAITFIIQSFIIAYKYYHIESKFTTYIFNALTIIATFILCAITNYNEHHSEFTNMLKYGILFMVVADVFAVYDFIKHKKKGISRLLVKQTVDNSQSGIIAFNHNGKVMFQNDVMYRIMQSLDIHGEHIEKLKQIAKEKIGDDYVVLVQGKPILFCISNDQKEITAFDIEEEYTVREKLREQTKKIEENNEKLIYAMENVEELQKAEKTLQMKNKLHDILGQNLSVLQACLNTENLNEERFEDVKFMIKQMFTSIDEVDDPYSSLDNLIRVNENLGVKIKLKGELPKNKEEAKVFFEIIRDAVTNAVKHADSTEIRIDIKDNTTYYQLTIHNNGKKAKEVIVENDGIKGMRRKANEIGYEVKVNTIPEFQIVVMKTGL